MGPARMLPGLITERQKPLLDRSALLSSCGLYRYTLHRNWTQEADAGQVLWIMINPSTADGRQDDPTIRRCMSFSRRFGCGGMTVVNLFALRSPNPTALLYASDPVGPDNDAHLQKWIEAHGRRQDYIVAAWGGSGSNYRLKERRDQVLRLLPVADVFCLGMTRNGNPVHPLYVSGDRTLNSYEFPASAWATTLPAPSEQKETFPCL